MVFGYDERWTLTRYPPVRARKCPNRMAGRKMARGTGSAYSQRTRGRIDGHNAAAMMSEISIEPVIAVAAKQKNAQRAPPWNMESHTASHGLAGVRAASADLFRTEIAAACNGAPGNDAGATCQVRRKIPAMHSQQIAGKRIQTGPSSHDIHSAGPMDRMNNSPPAPESTRNKVRIESW